jgi:hypothetical protein
LVSSGTVTQLSGHELAGNNILDWSSVNEYGVKQYELQRSNNGEVFNTIATRKPANQNSVADYSYTDNTIGSLPQLEWYYRIKMTDVQGLVKYSRVVLLSKESVTTAFKVLGNPFDSRITVTIKLNTNSQVLLNLYNANGVVIQKQQVNSTTGTNTVSIDNLSNLPSGWYVVEVVIGNRKFSQKLLKN